MYNYTDETIRLGNKMFVGINQQNGQVDGYFIEEVNGLFNICTIFDEKEKIERLPFIRGKLSEGYTLLLEQDGKLVSGKIGYKKTNNYFCRDDEFDTKISYEDESFDEVLVGLEIILAEKSKKVEKGVQYQKKERFK